MSHAHARLHHQIVKFLKKNGGGMAWRNDFKRTMNLTGVIALAMLVGFGTSAMAQTRQLLKPGVVIKTAAVKKWQRCDEEIHSHYCNRRGKLDYMRYYLIFVRDPSGQSEVMADSQTPFSPGEKVIVVFEPYGYIWIAPSATRE